MSVKEVRWMLMLDCRKGMVVDGRSGRNKICSSEHWICTNTVLNIDCMRKSVTTMALWCKCTSPLIGLKAVELRAFEETIGN